MLENLATQEIQGHGESSLADLVELRKALEIGYSQPTTGTGFDALRVESLESTLKLLTYSQQHVRLWNMIPKADAFSTVEEYNRLLQYGGDGGGFVASGALPEEEDSSYERADQKVKYLGTTRSVHHPATLVRSVPADIISQETQNGALWLMGKANHGLYYGDADAIPLEWNGLAKQIEDGGGHIIDMKGQPLTPDNITEAAQKVVDNFGVATQFFSNGQVFTDFSDTYNQYQRFAAPGGTAGVVGTPVTGFSTLNGVVNFQPDVFVKRGTVAPTAPVAKAPNTPSLSLGAPTGTGTNFGSGDAGTYKYQVTAVNAFGESAPCAVSAGVAISAGNYVDLTITDGGGTYGATAYKVYRTEKDGLTLTYIGKIVPRAKASGVYTSPTTFRDNNDYRPNCWTGLMLDMSNQSLTFKQLAPMMKMNLAIISPAIRWMQLLYGTPIVYAPKKNVVFRNIGKA